MVDHYITAVPNLELSLREILKAYVWLEIPIQKLPLPVVDSRLISRAGRGVDLSSSYLRGMVKSFNKLTAVPS